jgi:NitT/TauT family transport system substrate-binding protein
MKRLAVVVTCVLALLLLGLPEAGAQGPIKIGLTIWVGFGPLYIAQAKGFFKAQGVDVEFVQIEDTKMAYAALAAKRIDGYGATPQSLLLNVKPDQRYIMVMTLDDSKGGDGVVAKKDVKSLAELKGKRVAFMEGSVAHYYLAYVLKRVGLTEKDVIGVNMTSGDAGAAFVAGRVDAAVTWEPWLSRAKATPHGQILIDSSQTPGIIIDTLVFREDVVKSRPADIRKIVHAVHQAVDHWKANPKESVEIMAKGVGGWLKETKDFEEALAGAKLYDRADNRRFMGTKQSPGDMYKLVGDVITFWREAGKLVWPDVKAEDLIDPSFLE